MSTELGQIQIQGTSALKLKTALSDKRDALEEYAEIEAEAEESASDWEDELAEELASHGRHQNLTFCAFTVMSSLYYRTISHLACVLSLHVFIDPFGDLRLYSTGDKALYEKSPKQYPQPHRGGAF